MVLLVAAPAAARAQHVDTVKHLSTAYLKPGLRQYFIYMQDTASKKTLVFWYWLRRVDLETRDGVPVFHISQHWYGQDTAMYREVYSVNKVADFAPVYHEEIKRGKVFAYNWDDQGIKGADTVWGNTAHDFSLAFTRPNLNWNLDIETFEMLPLAEGRAFAINFYDAGLDPPQYVVYSVKGSEVIQTLGGAEVDCWKLVTEGHVKDMHYTETYWISKKKHEFLKEEDHYGASFRLKILMPVATPDPLSHT
ncbi:hypothetical protein EDB95_4131 [Dinghuibacter silviterrae]|uniref:Uncharacterized protein n=2 Tax=Dinghuibacter silviterrae TaxID=1539049 RepID=A0A4R8DFQ5_9BACT|nr:hypothetical protein EDB95_4131 [Dinghuibacter silviterrae]